MGGRDNPRELPIAAGPRQPRRQSSDGHDPGSRRACGRQSARRRSLVGRDLSEVWFRITRGTDRPYHIGLRATGENGKAVGGDLFNGVFAFAYPVTASAISTAMGHSILLWRGQERAAGVHSRAHRRLPDTGFRQHLLRQGRQPHRFVGDMTNTGCGHRSRTTWTRWPTEAHGVPPTWAASKTSTNRRV